MNVKKPSLSHPHDYLRHHDLHVQAGTCFVLMPFAEEFTIVYETIAEALRGLLTCTRADDMALGKEVLERILSGISSAELIIADLTGRNANVFYELGLAHSQTKNVLLLTRNREDVPYDLRGYFCHKYSCSSKAGLASLSAVVARAARAVIVMRPPSVLDDPLVRTRSIVDALSSRLQDPAGCRELTIRIQASVSSLGNIGRPEAEDATVRAYGRLLEEERELLIRVVEKGARLRAVLWPHSVPVGRPERLAERNARIDRVIAFLRRKDSFMRRCEFVVAPPFGLNLFFIGDDLLFEGHKTEVAHGFGHTNVITDRGEIESRRKMYDSFFASAREYTIETYGGRDKKPARSQADLVVEALEQAKHRQHVVQRRRLRVQAG